jgi:deazaflavin-dependent oxidoreductase (nitroreductase family)
VDIIKVADKNYIHLTTTGRKSGEPRTVKLWFAISEGKIYLSHEGKYADWMRNILKDNRVGFKIENIPFKGKARIVEDQGTFDVGKHALYLKYYGKASDDAVNDWFSESTVIEISVVGQT